MVDGVIHPGAVGVLHPVPGVFCPVVEYPADPAPRSVLVVSEDYSLIHILYETACNFLVLGYLVFQVNVHHLQALTLDPDLLVSHQSPHHCYLNNAV